jgi:hypothetical protein
MGPDMWSELKELTRTGLNSSIAANAGHPDVGVPTFSYNRGKLNEPPLARMESHRLFGAPRSARVSWGVRPMSLDRLAAADLSAPPHWRKSRISGSERWAEKKGIRPDGF